MEKNPRTTVQRPFLPTVVVVTLLAAACGPTALPAKPTPATKTARPKVDSHNSGNTKWISESLDEMQRIKVGMTRKQLLTVFATEGGLSSRGWRRYVYRGCPYIKVDVEFRAVGGLKKYAHSESRNDVITKISKPFLEWSIKD